MTEDERRFMDAAIAVCQTFYGGPTTALRQRRLHNLLTIYEHAIRPQTEPMPLRGKIAKSRVVDGNIVIDGRLD